MSLCLPLTRGQSFSIEWCMTSSLWGQLVRDTRRERAEAAPAMSPHRALVWSWRQWQLVLHGALRGALGNTGRALLRVVRGTRLLRSR